MNSNNSILALIFSLLFTGVVPAMTATLPTNEKDVPAAPSTSGTTRPVGSMNLQIVNATSVEKISLDINNKPLYPQLRQGQWIGTSTWDTLSNLYEVRDLASGRKASSESTNFTKNSSQTLVIMGDFSTDCPPDKLPQPAQAGSDIAYPPNVQFRFCTHKLHNGEKALRYQFVNAMPRNLLQIEGPGLASTSVRPGEDVIASGQSIIANYHATVAGESYELHLAQKHPGVNLLVVFYLKNNKPAHLVVSQEN